jgi:hypothetical protein
MLPQTIPDRVDGSYLATDYKSVSILRGFGGVEALEELPTILFRDRRAIRLCHGAGEANAGTTGVSFARRSR